MSHTKRPVPEVDQVTLELEALLVQFTDEEIETGVVARGGTATETAERHNAAALRDLLAGALHGDFVHDDGSTSQIA